MIIDFVLQVASKCFRGYVYALSFLSILITLSSMAIAKLTISLFKPALLTSVEVKSFFQLSVLLFIPVFFILHIRKHKYAGLISGSLSVKPQPFTISLISVVALTIFCFFLLAYLLV